MSSDFEPAMPGDPFLTPQEQLMIDIGWLDLWHALREASTRAPEQAAHD
jgi:hypothetical protein